jgi:hypothetical protein
VRAEAAPAAASAASAVSATTSVATDTAAATRSTSPAVRDDDERKALAWSRYYQRPASCEGNPSTEQLVECANHFIRTKRLFDAEWAAGRL